MLTKLIKTGSGRACVSAKTNYNKQTTAPLEHDAANWLLVFDVTDDVDGKRSSKPTWRPRASCGAYQATREEVSRFTSGRPA